MKTKILCILLAAFGCGCVSTKDSIQVGKTTVFGLELVDPTGNVGLRIGLCRHSRMVVPIYTNTIYVPNFATTVNAKLPLGSTAVETYTITNH